MTLYDTILFLILLFKTALLSAGLKNQLMTYGRPRVRLSLDKLTTVMVGETEPGGLISATATLQTVDHFLHTFDLIFGLLKAVG